MTTRRKNKIRRPRCADPQKAVGRTTPIVLRLLLLLLLLLLLCNAICCCLAMLFCILRMPPRRVGGPIMLLGEPFRPTATCAGRAPGRDRRLMASEFGCLLRAAVGRRAHAARARKRAVSSVDLIKWALLESKVVVNLPIMEFYDFVFSVSRRDAYAANTAKAHRNACVIRQPKASGLRSCLIRSMRKVICLRAHALITYMYVPLHEHSVFMGAPYLVPTLSQRSPTTLHNQTLRRDVSYEHS